MVPQLYLADDEEVVRTAETIIPVILRCEGAVNATLATTD